MSGGCEPPPERGGTAKKLLATLCIAARASKRKVACRLCSLFRITGMQPRMLPTTLPRTAVPSLHSNQGAVESCCPATRSETLRQFR